MKSHIQTINYSIQIGDCTEQRVAIFNTNKLPTGLAEKCIMSDVYNKYLITMSAEQYVALFLDDGEFLGTTDYEDTSAPVVSMVEDKLNEKLNKV